MDPTTEDTQPTVTPEAPQATVDQPVAEPGAAPETPPAAGTSDEATFETPFRLEDVDEAYREHVERYVKQTQGAYTKKTQELAAQRAAVADVEGLLSRLESDEERTAALQELAARYDIELDFDEEAEGEETPPPSGEAPAGDDPLAARIAALEAERQAERDQAEQQVQNDYVNRVRTTIEDGLDAYRKQLKVDELSPLVRDQLIATIRAQPPIEEDGVQLPDVEGAIKVFEAAQAAYVQEYLNSKRAPEVNASGSSGEPKFDSTDPVARRERALAIAGRHLG